MAAAGIKNVHRPNISQWREANKMLTTYNHAPTSNTAAVVTLDADSVRANTISTISYSYSGTPTNGTLKIEDGSGTTVFGPHAVAAAGLQQLNFDPPIHGSINAALIVTLAAGGSGVSGALTLNAWKEE